MKEATRWYAGLAALLTLLAACGGGLHEVKDVQGASFELTGNDVSTAADYERVDPAMSAGAEVGCSYWQRRMSDVGSRYSSHETLLKWTGAKRAEVCDAAAARREQLIPPVLAARLNGTTIDVVITKNSKPLASEEVTATVGTNTLRGTTGVDGRVSLDLGAGITPTPALLAAPMAVISHQNTRDVTVDISGAPVLATWRQKLVEQKQANEQQAREAEYATTLAECKDAQTAQTCNPLMNLASRPEFAGHKPEVMDTLRVAYPHVLDALASQLLDDCRGDNADCEGGGKVLMELITRVSDDLHFINDAPARIGRVRKIVAQGKVAAAANAAESAGKQQGLADWIALQRTSRSFAARATALGRRGVLGALKSPSSARFVSDKVVLQCPGHDVFFTEHVVDSQNGFGVMLRSTVWATESLKSGTGEACLDVCQGALANAVFGIGLAESGRGDDNTLMSLQMACGIAP